MKHDISTYLDERLINWAEWYTRYLDSGLGYPSQSIESLLLQHGGAVVKTTGSKPLPVCQSAEEIENMISELAKQNLKLANALRTYYLQRGSMQHKAKCLSISYSQFKVYVDMAKQWLIGRLTAKLIT